MKTLAKFGNIREQIGETREHVFSNEATPHKCKLKRYKHNQHPVTKIFQRNRSLHELVCGGVFFVFFVTFKKQREYQNVRVKTDFETSLFVKFIPDKNKTDCFTNEFLHQLRANISN